MTTIKQITDAALVDARGRQGDKNQLSLHIAPGGQELRFYPPVQPVAGGAPGNVREALTTAVLAQLCTHEGWAAKPENTRVYAEQILQQVLGDSQAPSPTLMQLLDLHSKTKGIAEFMGTSTNSREVEEIWRNANTLTEAMSRTYKGMEELEPWHRGVTLLSSLRSVGRLSGQSGGAAEQLWRDLEAVVKYLGIEKLVLPNSTDIKRYDSEVERRVATTPALQYAIAEFGSEGLNTSQPAFNIFRFAGLLPLMSEHALEPVFIDSHGFARLKFEISKLSKGKDKSWIEQMNRKLTILLRNTQRYDNFLGSPLSGVPSINDHISVEFQVTMLERLSGNFNPLLCTNKALIYCPVVSALHANWKSVPDAPLSVRLQSSLAELIDTDDESLKSQWEAAAADVEAAGFSQLVHIYAYEDIIGKLEQVLLDRGNGKLTRPTAAKLQLLQQNAARMEAFLGSPVSRQRCFDDVERALLIPWWDAVKHVFSFRAVHQSEDRSGEEGAVVIQTPEVPVQEPAEPTHEANLQPTLQAPTDSTHSTTPVVDARIAEREVKHPVADASAPRSSQASQAAPQVFLRPAQLLPSANPVRTDRPPTGRERERRNSRTGHHDSSKAKWLSADVRRFRAAQADLAAIPESKR